MLDIKVSVPELGERLPFDSPTEVLGDEKSVRMTLGDEEGPVTVAQMPAVAAMKLSRDLWVAARKADPEGTSFGAIVRGAQAANA